MPTKPDYSYGQVGNVSLPLPSPGTNGLLQDADPALFFALDWFSFVITQFAGARLLAAASGAGMGTGANAITAAVAQRYPRSPRADWLQNQLKTPLLAVARTRTMTGRLTAGWEHDRGYFDLFYVLPPMTAAQEEAIAPILNAVEKALRSRTTQAWDPNYTPPGGVSGAQFDSLAYAGVESIGFGDPYRDVVEDAVYGYLEGTGGLLFPTLTMRGYVIERDMPVRGFSDVFAGGDITGNVQADDGTVVPATSTAIVQASTQQAPTLTGVSPSGGPVAGGTSVTLTGTLFLGAGPTIPQVLFGSLQATDVAVVSSTEVTCTSPASSGAGTVPVTLINADGQQVTLANAFTYS